MNNSELFLFRWSNLYRVEARRPIVPANGVEMPVDGAELVGGAAAVHAGDGLPAIPSRIEPFTSC